MKPEHQLKQSGEELYSQILTEGTTRYRLSTRRLRRRLRRLERYRGRTAVESLINHCRDLVNRIDDGTLLTLDQKTVEHNDLLELEQFSQTMAETILVKGIPYLDSTQDRGLGVLSRRDPEFGPFLSIILAAVIGWLVQKILDRIFGELGETRATE